MGGRLSRSAKKLFGRGCDVEDEEYEESVENDDRMILESEKETIGILEDKIKNLAEIFENHENEDSKSSNKSTPQKKNYEEITSVKNQVSNLQNKFDKYNEVITSNQVFFIILKMC